MAATQDSIVAGLFTTPEQYQEQQRQALYNQAVAESKLDPYQQARVSLQTGVQGLANAGAGMLGVEDPQMKLRSMRQQVMQGMDPNDPNSLAQGAQTLNQEGDAVGAEALIKAAQARSKDLLEAEVKQSQITKNLRTRPDRPANLSELGKLQAEREDIITEFGPNDPRVKDYDNKIAKLSKGGGIGSEIAAGLSPILGAMAGAQAKKAAEAGGTDVGKKIADIEGSQSALIAIQGAKGIFNKGIYAGKYGPTMENLSGYSEGVIGSKERLANTETFRSYLGDVVIPGLKDFGGSDTVEELKYLQAVYAGDTTAQPKALKNMLDRAESKITSKINRIQAQQTAIQTGQPLPTGPSTTGAPKATRRFNMQTGKFETIPQ